MKNDKVFNQNDEGIFVFCHTCDMQFVNYHFIFGLSPKCQEVEKNFKENMNLTRWVVMNCALSSSSFSTDPTD